MQEMEGAGHVVYGGSRRASDSWWWERPELDAPKRLRYAALPTSLYLSGVRAPSSYTLRPQFTCTQLGADSAIGDMEHIEVARRARHPARRDRGRALCADARLIAGDVR